jgi:phosphohistidine phosphatase SixA
MLAFAMMTVIRHRANAMPPPKNDAALKAKDRQLIRWSIQEIRRIATRLARQRVHPAHIIAWSLWRRAHQAAAQKAHVKSKSQLLL